MIGGTYATFDVLAEFVKSSAVRVVFGLQRDSRATRGRLRRFKVALPMPRIDEDPQPAAQKGALKPK